MKNKKQIIYSVVTLVIVVAIILTLTLTLPKNSNKMKKVKFETNHGDIIINLYSDMPITTGNFEKLVKEGFYDGVIFHRIIPSFMIQGGDPTGTGMGGPGYNIKDEFTHAGGNKNNRGKGKESRRKNG